MRYNIGLTVGSDLKRILDMIPSGKRSEIIRQAIFAYAPKINSMKKELLRIRKEEEEHYREIEKQRKKRKLQAQIHYESVAQFEVKKWLERLNESRIDRIS